MVASAKHAALVALTCASVVACDGDAAGCPEAVITLPGSSVALDWWQGDPPPEARAAVIVESEGCGFTVEADVPWLSVEVDADGLRLSADPGALSSGLHVESLEFVSAGSDASLASLEVELRVVRPPPVGARTHVVVVGVDGLRPDALAAADTPTFDRFIAHGAWSLSGTTHLEASTVSGPGWATILTGVDADKHLVVDNDTLDQIDRAYPTMLARARTAGLGVDLSIHWTGIYALIEPEVETEYQFASDEQVAGRAVGLLGDESLRLLFLHFDDVDGAGHDTGFSADNPDYIDAIETTDGHVQTVLGGLAARPGFADEDWLIAVTTDHGGDGTGHGALNEANRTIPIIFASMRLTPGELAGTPSHADVYPTVLSYLGVEPEPAWGLDGQVAVRPE